MRISRMVTETASVVTVMHKIISVVLALCLTAFGAFELVYLMVFSAGWRGWMVIGAGLLFAVGVMWLYSDYMDATPRKPSRRPPSGSIPR
jgi:hypothetical protein